MRYKLGVSETTWTYIAVASGILLLLTTSRSVANTVGKDGIFGYGKSKKLATFGKGREKTWGDLQTLSLGLVAVTMLETGHDSLQRLAELKNQSKLNDTF